ncbi:MAG: hypothetical protein QOE75_2539 [Solirubrobacterales bacterium]|jgi:hypothetical protein|nr:hypothetical protein [Solirubrobacterales bacterium]
MSAPARLAIFSIGLLALALAAFAVGKQADVAAPGASAEPAAEHMGGMDAMEGAHEAHPVRGLGVAENGLRLQVADPELARGATERLTFQIVGESGRPITEFDLTHTKRMHVIVVRRDLTGFQHLHPEMAADGTWSVPLRLAEAGTYRVFADFSHGGEAVTLADDLRVDGEADLRALPAPATRALGEPGGYAVDLRAGDSHAGDEASLRFSVTRAGEAAPLEPYLGAGGHLVALREGDLAFLHVHPTGDGGEDGSVEFEATFPTAGRYRLFLQFVVDGELQTVAFTEEVR